jgi:hypothetical protein
MMMDAIVQLVRNALCCVKDWELFRHSVPVLYDANFTSYFYRLPSPLNETTPLEILISVCQFYAFWSLTRSGLALMASSHAKFNYFLRLMDYRTDMKAAHRLPPSEDLVNESLLREGEISLRSTIVGFLTACIGVSFLWLGANSWHVTSTRWLGGMQGLVHALTLMEVCLLPLLYYMWEDGARQLGLAKTMNDLADKIEKEGALEKVSIDELQLLAPEFKPVWAHASPVKSWSDLAVAKDRDHLEREVQVVKSILDFWNPRKEKKKGAGESKESENDDGKDDAGEKGEKIRSSKVRELRQRAPLARWEGYREYTYFLLNFVAFYGYLQGILAFYFDDEDNLKGVWSLVVPVLKLGLPKDVADWRGNFVGDLMWTVEPAIILATPALFRRWSSSGTTISPPLSNRSKAKAE